ncbi:MAG TPA: hypothetical protein VE869_04565 [Gemmatimonas sp.]|nr:hypothetical protein [Gemmatimonas sp.]
MPRLLAFGVRRIDADARSVYLADVRRRQAAAAAAGAHFWVFEHDSKSGRFVEFMEAASEAALRDFMAGAGYEGASLALWREVQGG